jgi:hypothetical protein
VLALTRRTSEKDFWQFVPKSDSLTASIWRFGPYTAKKCGWSPDSGSLAA